MLRLCRVLAVCVLSLMFVPTIVHAQRSKTAPTPTGYEEFWTGVGTNGADSLYHRVYVTRRTPPQDTVIVTLRGNPQPMIVSYAVHEQATVVGLEMAWFKRYLVIDEYPEVHERRFDHGWSVWFEGVPHRYIRIRFADVVRIILKQSSGIELLITPKLPE